MRLSESEVLPPVPTGLAVRPPDPVRHGSPVIEANTALSREDMAEKRLVLRSRPQVVFVELSRRCNLACSMCHRWTLSRGSFVDMADDLIESLVEELFPTAALVDLHGLGESTLHPRFSEVVRRTAARGSRVRLVTNMNGLRQEVMETLVDVDAYVCFSLGALGQKAYSRIYARGDFADLSANLRTLQQLRERSGTCRDMTCMSMIYRPNLGEITDVMRFVADHGVRNHRIFPMYLKPGDPRFVGDHLDEWQAAVDAAFDLADELGMEVRVIDWPVRPSGSAKTLAAFGCHRPWTHVHVNVDGKVGLCDYNEHVDSMSSLFFGQASVDEIWNGPIYQSIRASFRDGQPSRASSFCGDVCRHTKYVDFDDKVLPELGARVLSNLNRGL
jgi:MoaA/NifB/PqqE/SkfB family radical SAM enzyme